MRPSKPVETRSRQYKLPEPLTSVIDASVKTLGYSLERPTDLAKAVQRLSDYYIENPKASTPWHQPWAQAAYIAYYFPLNFLRMSAVFDELRRVNFFAGLDRFVDFGCGLSAVPFLCADTPLKQGVGIDKSVEALQILETMLQKNSFRMRLYQQFNEVLDYDRELGIFSYVMTETQKLPRWAPDLEAILIIEPSTRDDGRRLMELREALIEEEYFVWAPCTHQKNCPLSYHSKKDWCHDRILVEMPTWFQTMESHLPMKNNSITYSYLAVRQSPPKLKQGLARSVGDLLDENGKYRQLVCRGEDREFLAWLKKEHQDAPEILRGHLLELPTGLEKKSDEIRIPSGKEIPLALDPTKG